ncbi:MAG: hypothetical protein QXZ48_05640 [Zestosphaera sp.]
MYSILMKPTAAGLLAGCRKFATLDTDIIKESNIVSKALCIGVLAPPRTQP